MIRRVFIRNYRRFREFDISFSSQMNVLVGINDTGKSTLVEAINLALTGRVHGRPLLQELSPFLLNLEATKEYVQQLRSSSKPIPPQLIIEVFLDDAELEILQGTNNLIGEDACGIRIQAKLSEEFHEEYEALIANPDSVSLVPTEYYRVDWLGFSGNGITSRSVPTSVSVIDAATIRLQSGVDQHLQQIVRTHLKPNERVELSRQYRSLREEFSGKESIKAINQRLNADRQQQNLSLGLDISQRYTWESSLTAHLDELPYNLAGQGDQNTLKILLAIGRQTDDTHVVLIEEPENHLSFAPLRELVRRIEQRCAGKQVILTTHSTFVLNKLGLDNLVLLGEDSTVVKLCDLPADTVEFFKKLAGFETLRLVLAKGVILVEGPSDELVVQRAYHDQNKCLPIDDGIDVISVGLSHKRFLDLAVKLKRRVWIIRDNDGKTMEEIRSRFADYLDHDFISLHTGENPEHRTLEPQVVAANDLNTLNRALGTTFSTAEEAIEGMTSDKTGYALKIFAAEHAITMPKYIRDAFTD